MFLNLRIAVQSLSTHKLRAVLAMLGVFLGALAFTGVQHVSQALELKAEQEAEKLGPSLFAVLAGQVRFTRGGDARLGQAQRNFTVSDARAVAGGTPSVLSAAAFATATCGVRFEGGAVNATLVATWPEYPDIRSFHPEFGRFLTQDEEDDRDKVLVLGRTIAERLFQRPEAALGRLVYLNHINFRVVGVMEQKGRDLSGANQEDRKSVV